MLLRRRRCILVDKHARSRIRVLPGVFAAACDHRKGYPAAPSCRARTNRREDPLVKMVAFTQNP
jgi:hypothetical protein